MKRFLLFSLAAGFAVVSAFAGGLVTNTNQSASWVRNPARDASRGIDAVYYNPAGIMGLSNGLHFSISNQYITQKKEVTNDYMYLNQSLYKGSVKAPIFPSFYAAYKLDRVAFSFGFNPIGGGGGATFDKGLPSFELSQSDLVPGLASRGVTGYNLDAYFEGSSVFFGYQGGVTFKLSDIVSVYGGVRYVTAKNTYMGHLNDVQINLGGTWLRADTYFNGLVSQLGGIMAIPTGLQQLVDLGVPSSFTLDQVVGLNNPAFDATKKAGIVAALGALGVNPTTADAMSLAQIQGAISLATPGLAANQAVAGAKAHLLRDQSVDAEQTGSGICPILGINLTLSEKLNIGFKYEFLTKMDLVNKTSKDFTTYWTGADSVTMFPDGEKTASDMPSMISVGIDYKISDKLKLSLGTHIYDDKSANYGKKVDYDLNPATPALALTNEEVIDRNFFEIAGGLEYQFNDQLLLSAGYLYARNGVNQLYQNDLSYTNISSTIGFGGEYAINEMMKLNCGVGFTLYQDSEKLVGHLFDGEQTWTNETYAKTTMILSVGLDIALGK